LQPAGLFETFVASNTGTTPTHWAVLLHWCSLVCSDAKKLERLLPMLVALRGRVESNDPKQCELSERKAVIHEVSVG